MGKGKRDREKRRRTVDPGWLIDELLDLENQDGFLELVERHPEILEEPARKGLAKMTTVPGGLVFARWQRLLVAAQEDPVAAWHDHSTKMAEDDEAGEALGHIVDEVREAQSRREPVRVIELAEPAIPIALAAELAPTVSILEAELAHAYLNSPNDDRANNVDAAVSGFARALSMTIEPEEASRLHMYLGIAVAERPREDPTESVAASINIMRDGLRILPENADPDLRTSIETNLASSLLRSTSGERIDNLQEALALCTRALEHRSIERDPNEWVYGQLNLAATLLNLSELGEAKPSEAYDALREVIDAGALIEDRHVAHAHYQFGRALRITAQQGPKNPSDDWDASEWEEAFQQDETESARQLSEAREQLEAAAALVDPEKDPLQAGRIYTELADVLDRLDESELAILAAEAGMQLLPPTSDPRESAQVAGRLGHLLALQKDWEKSAAAFRVAIEAGELAFLRRLDAEGRRSEAGSTQNLTRWASHAIAIAGNPAEAVMILESGRSRDLRQRLGLGGDAAQALGDLPEALKLSYLTATNALARSPLGDEGDAASRALQEVLRDIREVKGFEEFATRPTPTDLVGAVEPDWPLLYVNPTPYGTSLLLLQRDDAAHVTVKSVLLEHPTSLEVLLRLLAGDASEDLSLLEDGGVGSYLAGASGFSGDERDIDIDVEHVLPWLGESLAAPIHEALGEANAKGVTLIDCGPVALAPLHAAPWSKEGAERCLVDDFDIRHAPSGAFAAASLSRAGEREALEPSLVALSDPEGNLPAAGPEVEGLILHFNGRVARADGTAATWPFLQDNAAGATFIHLACHAGSGIWGDSMPAISLADGPVEVTRLTELAELHARLITVSACQSGVVDISHSPEEGISLGSVLLAAGAAGVIASLWPVRDDTTALLMTRLYDELFEHHLRPPEALRRAQIWLRDLTDDELDEYLEHYPSLKEEFRRREALGDRAGVRAAGDISKAGPAEHPFSKPAYWAPFLALGA